MRNSIYFSAFALFLAASSTTYAAVSITPDYSILSGIQDTSNLDYSTTRYRGTLNSDGADGDLYINSVQFIPGAGYDPNIGLQFNVGTSFDYNSGQTYTLGTPISGPANWSLDRIITHDGAIDPSVAPGIYDFSAVFTGGDSPSATDTLATWNLQIEVFPYMDITLGGSSSPAVIGYGDTTTVQVTLTNNMVSRSFFSYTWWYGGGGMQQGSAAMQGNFVGDWFNQEIAAGDSRTDDHTTWTADSSSLPTGTYVGSLGLYGGLYLGDEHSITALNPQPTVELIPEPVSIGMAGAGILIGLTARRRRA